MISHPVGMKALRTNVRLKNRTKADTEMLSGCKRSAGARGPVALLMPRCRGEEGAGSLRNAMTSRLLFQLASRKCAPGTAHPSRVRSPKDNFGATTVRQVRSGKCPHEKRGQ